MLHPTPCMIKAANCDTQRKPRGYTYSASGADCFHARAIMMLIPRLRPSFVAKALSLLEQGQQLVSTLPGGEAPILEMVRAGAEERWGSGAYNYGIVHHRTFDRLCEDPFRGSSSMKNRWAGGGGCRGRTCARNHVCRLHSHSKTLNLTARRDSEHLKVMRTWLQG